MGRIRNKKTITLVIIGASFIITGIVIAAIHAYPPYEKAEKLSKQQIHEPKDPTEQLYELIPLRLKTDNPNWVVMDVIFERGLVIAKEGVNYRSAATFKNSSDVELIALTFPPTPDVNLDMTKEEAYDHVVGLRDGNRVIELTPITDPPFQKESNIMFYFEQDVYVVGYIFRKDQPLEILGGNNDIIFKVYPITSKLELEATIATIEQSHKQETATLAQNISNNQILALTWLGIAAIPMLVGTDLLIRTFLDKHN